MTRLDLCIGALLLGALPSAVLCAAPSTAYVPADIVNPRSFPAQCGRPAVSASSVCDPDRILSAEDGDVIEGRINGIKDAEIAVLILKKMDSQFIGFRGKDAAAEAFARSVHDTWKVGDATRNDGVLVFVAVEDRVMYISVGRGVQGRLTDVVLAATIENMKTYLRNSEYAGAIEFAVVDLGLYVAGRKTPPQDNAGYLFGGIVLIAGIGLSVLGIYSERERARLAKGNSKMQGLLKEISTEEDNVFRTRSCPICLEDFPEACEQTQGEAHTVAPESPSAPLLRSAASPTRPVALRCGHVFCLACIDQHLKSSTGGRCPICRKNVDGSEPASDSHRPSQPCSSSFSGAGYQSELSIVRRTDLLYRINRMHVLYPSVMTRDTQRSMEDAVAGGNMQLVRSIASERLVLVQRSIAEAAQRAAARTSGSGGAGRSSFGGGGSSGGRGGSW